MTVNAPQADRKTAFRHAAGSFPTGVCVVIADHEGAAAGMTLNSFTSISLDPLLVLISLAHGARTLTTVHASGKFALSILHRGQSEIALEFAARGSAFPGTHVHRLDDGSLVVRHALAHLLCDVDAVVTAGDHDLVLGAVRDFEAVPGEPLVFHAGRFGGVAVDADAPSGFAAILDEGIGW